MKFYNHLYLTDHIDALHLRLAKRQIKKGKLQAGFHVIALDESGKDSLIIYPYFEWNSKRVDRERARVVGIGFGYLPSRYLVLQMVKDAYAARGDANVKSYFFARDPGLMNKEENA